MTIRWVLEKKDLNSGIGITFGGPTSTGPNDFHPVFIWTSKGGRMKKIDIVPGLRVSKICDKWVRNAEQANRIVKLAPAGPIPVETYGKYYPFEKTTKDEKAGLALQMTKFPLALPNGVRAVQEVVEITKVHPYGMFSEVQEGHLLWGINGKKITAMKQAIKLLRSKHSLRIVVLDPATLDATVKNVVSSNPSTASTVSTSVEPMPSEPLPQEEEKDDQKSASPELPDSPIMTVNMKQSYECEEELSSVYDDETTTFFEGDEEFETGPALWC